MVVRKYNDKDILLALAEGRSLKEIAKSYGYADTRPIDNYMKSQGYIWNPNANIYRKLRTTVEGLSTTVETKEKVAEIILYFSSGMYAREISKRFGFSNTRDLANYMKKQGFEWNTSKNNYVAKANSPIPTPSTHQASFDSIDRLSTQEIDFLKELLTYRHILLPMLQVKDALEPSFPVYHLEGITHSKSVQITASLDELIRSFCREKKITQKQVFEIAIIEFLQKYGYEKELTTILQFNNGSFPSS